MKECCVPGCVSRRKHNFEVALDFLAVLNGRVGLKRRHYAVAKESLGQYERPPFRNTICEITGQTLTRRPREEWEFCLRRVDSASGLL